MDTIRAFQWLKKEAPYLQEMSFDSWKEKKEVMITVMIMMIIDDHYDYDHQVIILYVLCYV